MNPAATVVFSHAHTDRDDFGTTEWKERVFLLDVTGTGLSTVLGNQGSIIIQEPPGIKNGESLSFNMTRV
jgi:hypothetical protein